MITLNSKLPHVGTTVFTVMSQLAQEYNAINLSQGFPDYDADPALFDLNEKAMKAGKNQYAAMPGLPALRERIAAKTRDLYGVGYNPESEITVTAGGTQALFTAIAAVVVPGDEVIIFEPAYDSYAPTVRLFGGLVKPYELEGPDFRIDWDMVKKLFTAQTRMIIINTPQNPTGTTLSEADMQELIRLTRDTDVIILSDEVYEHLVYDGRQHLSVSLYPELRERSFIVYSFGKLLHATGWKIGYCLAPESLMAAFRKIHQFNVFSVNTPMQHAIHAYLEEPQHYLALPSFFQEKRDLFRNMMQQTKFTLLPCQGSYFQCVSYQDISKEPDTEMAMRMVKDFGVACIPVSSFYTRKTEQRILRFCFAKRTETLEQAVNQLSKIH
ncbi:methionine aminotransferase [Pedobacter yulinensis]|uniref:Methionine aminotransferase n=1 Tax=Pedobacter yulinensis TaxID=2126353 RepID=A0A2T3HKR1_9SPHI|nr:methionine aminotransferase [Pedobacter yulinensis]PST83016.1 methionine aminotransferase [Pedobacter yulinensis]